jgi:hypothetical protein
MHIPNTAGELLAALAESETTPEPKATPPSVEPDYTFTDPGPGFDPGPLSDPDPEAAREARLRREIRKAIAEIRQRKADAELLARLLGPQRPPAQGDVGTGGRWDWRGWMP